MFRHVDILEVQFDSKVFVSATTPQKLRDEPRIMVCLLYKGNEKSNLDLVYTVEFL